jgi:hypothetical protein
MKYKLNLGGRVNLVSIQIAIKILARVTSIQFHINKPHEGKSQHMSHSVYYKFISPRVVHYQLNVYNINTFLMKGRASRKHKIQQTSSAENSSELDLSNIKTFQKNIHKAKTPPRK